MTATPAERAAALSARIHRNLRKSPDGGWSRVDHLWSEDEALEFALGWWCDGPDLDGHLTSSLPFARLGAELRAIALGNRKP